jgi:hypothetical protein
MDTAHTNNILYNLIISGMAGSVAKIGATELRFCLEYLRPSTKRPAKYSKSLSYEMLVNSGIFPSEDYALEEFGKNYITACNELSHLAVWFRPGESMFVQKHIPHAKLFRLHGLDPIQFGSESWLQGLKNKRVLLVTPFAKSILKQYERRNLVWKNCPGFLPEFEIDFLRAPLSAGLVEPTFKTWSETLQNLKSQMDQRKFDVALIGAGAFSIPLAIHAQSKGAVGIHLGGQLQVLFGVMGGRWEENSNLSQFVNDHWVRPSGDEVPKHFKKMEGGCYW